MRRRLVALAAALALTTAACGGPEPSKSYGGKAVAVNVSFGKPAPDDPRAPTVPFVLGPVLGGVGVVPVAEEPVKKRVATTLPPADDAPRLDCFVENGLLPPKKEATRELSGEVPFGDLIYRTEGPTGLLLFVRKVEDMGTAPTGARLFKVTSYLNGVQTASTYSSRAAADRVPGEVGLHRVEAEGSGIPSVPSFAGQKPVTLLPLNATQGQSFSDAAYDPKTLTTFKVDGLVIGKSPVWVCDGNVDAWQVKLSQDVVTPNQRIHAEITYWVATQYGGLIVKEAVAWSGTAGANTPVQGQYTATLVGDPK